MNESAHTQQPKQFKILLIGDNCIDVYQYGIIDRLSPEAPVPVFVPTENESKPGMSGNVFVNLANLGCQVNHLYDKVGKKTRLIDQRSRQQIARIDEDTISTPIEILTALPKYDAVVISDYNKGTVSYELIEDIIKESESGTKFPVFIDTKKTDLERFQGAWVKINSLEYSLLKSECSGLIVTRGDKGAWVPYHDINLPAPKVEVSDVCGAGDTFLAALTYKWCETKDITESVKFAIKASAITVQHLGNYAPTLEEIK